MNPEIALSNLTSVPVLAFALGVIASRLKSDLRVSKGAYEAITFILLLAIGFKGGLALHSTPLADIALPLILTIVIGCLIPLLAFVLLKAVPRLSRIDRGSLAAHYGSTSLVTFSAALVFLESANVSYEGYVTILLVAMEIPGLLIGITLAKGGLKGLLDRELLREVFLGKTVLLLVGGLVIGGLAGQNALAKVTPLFVDLQPGLLTLFLLSLGFLAGHHFSEFKDIGWRGVVFAIAFPVIAGALGALLGSFSGLSVGGATALATLCASASYIAAPAAVSLSLPTASKSIPIVSSLGVTFPFNLMLGIPIYFQIASWLA